MVMTKRGQLPPEGKVLAVYEELERLAKFNPVPYELIETDRRPVPGGESVGVYYSRENRWILNGLQELRRGSDDFDLIE